MNVQVLKAIRNLTLVLGVVLVGAGSVAAEVHERVRVPVGRSEIVPSTELVRTVAIAEPKIADAAVGSERTVIVNGKALGITTLVVYAEGGRFTVYDIEVYKPGADKQVMLHVRVAEANANARRELGFDLLGSGVVNSKRGGTITGAFYTTKVAQPSNPLGIAGNTDGFVSFNRPGNSLLQSTWRMLEESGDLRSLANPTLVAASGQKASFLAGGEFPVPISNGGSIGENGGGAAVMVEWKEFGVKVDFTPTVGEDGSITLEVEPEVSQLDFSNGIEINGFRIPSLVTRKTGTTVRLNPGEHLVIGGLKQTEKVKTLRRVPVLGKIPLVGFFFSNTQIEKIERELLIVVSPEMLVEASDRLPELPGQLENK